MRLLPSLFLMLSVGLAMSQTARSACAQESPLVPPWGRDLEEEHPSTEKPVREHTADSHEGIEQRREWRMSADFWLGWTKNDRIPALLTTGATADPRVGALGRPFTRVLYGDAVDFEDRPGGRFTVEVPIGTAGDWAMNAAYQFLDCRMVGPREASSGVPALARPFFNVLTNQEDSSLAAFPGTASGTVGIRSDSLLQSGEVNLVRVAARHENCFVALLLGARYLDLDENLAITETSRFLKGAPKELVGRNVSVFDRFGADNDFFGGQVGGLLEWKYKRWTATVSSKVALGNVHESISIRGRTVIDTTPVMDKPAGFLALASNSGQFSRDSFAVVPEIGATIGLQITERLSIRAGYTLLYWNRIVRPGDQIDRNLNPNQIPTTLAPGPADPRQPMTLFRTNDYWAQGMTCGLEFRY